MILEKRFHLLLVVFNNINPKIIKIASFKDQKLDNHSLEGRFNNFLNQTRSRQYIKFRIKEMMES